MAHFIQQIQNLNKMYQNKVITDPNVCLFGHVGSGKSSLAKSFAARCVAFGHHVYVAGDPKGEWTRVCRALGGQVIEKLLHKGLH